MSFASNVHAGLIAPLARKLWPDPAASMSSDDKIGFLAAGAYYSGNLAPVHVETTATDLSVTGSLPKELTGRFLRIGPNPFETPDPLTHDWFGGEGMVHGVRLAGGKAVWYRNRWVRNQEIVDKLSEDANGRKLSFSPNTNIFAHGGRTFASVEGAMAPIEMGFELDTIGQPVGWGTFSGHPKFDPDTGEMHAICYDWRKNRDTIKYVVVDAKGVLKKITEIKMTGRVIIHDMSLTKNYAVIYDLPLTMSFKQLFKGHQIPFRWDENHEPRVGLLPRNGTADDIIWCAAPSCYVFHPMNAYEDATGQVVLDVLPLKRVFDIDVHGPMGDSLPVLKRWTINPETKILSEEDVDDRAREFPAINIGYEGKPYQFGYSLAVDEDVAFPRLYKTDMHAGTSEVFEFGAGRHGAEPTFVAREGATSEDDGYLLFYVYDAGSDTSDLMILDAQDFSRPAIAIVHLPVRVPFGFHGNWIADRDIRT